MTKTYLLAALALASGLGAAQAQSVVDTSIYPQAKAGMTQHIFTLPAQENEYAFKVELVVGKTMMADCNRIMISGDVDSEDVKGWGYPYYEIEDISPPASTMMGCPEGAKTEKFIEVNLGDDALQRYNSKLPLVIYAPEDLTVGYRVWQTDGKILGNEAQ